MLHDVPVIDLSPSSIGKYFKTRISSLCTLPESHAPINPFPSLKHMTRRNWLFFGVAFFGWTWDAVDFFAVSITASEIAETLDRPLTDITWGITLVLMLRSVGAIGFGLAGDRWGRKWPFIINCAIFIVLEIGTGFVKTYQDFLAVRALFGVAMGGLFGNAAATALEDAPAECRGVLSGLFQQGYAFGYLLVVVFSRAFENTAKGWRSLFWFTAGPPVLIIAWRLCLPETDAFLNELRARKEAQEQGIESISKAELFRKQAKDALKHYWLITIYLVIFMAIMNFSSHGSQDLYPSMLKNQLGYSSDRVTVTMVVANLGALCGGVTMGHLSEFLGRRLTVSICAIIGGALIYPAFMLKNSGINAGVFFLQFMVQGAWGVCPVFLSEMSPPAFRAFVAGTSYQLGNLASSASSTIEARIGSRFPLGDKPGIYDYGKVMAIFMGCVFGALLIAAILGMERFHADFRTEEHIASEAAHDKFEEKAEDSMLEHKEN
ncbi:hypothetical protein CANCADRAFT_21700 [Tortispora caseinolytica NRRL Y-17796]|uniref:Major facilitator superfamily (MFS) profile domain-containing protein n=1 Tax=Tortispora caseinolytica NRRL Y-17796 TaxID=767744 RepID=A0A1E4TM98_9ASCO|nr:hypothetical protein CANCADRAFT_21700 [Tortispora caseinolytica NRRL Y-17796]